VRRPRQLGRIFNAMTRPQLDESETAIEQVRGLGFDPKDVRTSSPPTSTSTTLAACPTFPTPRSTCSHVS